MYSYLFRRQLSQISRSTRGVILLLCDLHKTRRIMSEAQRLNMAGGHFIWLWIDTTSSVGSYSQMDSRRAHIFAPMFKQKQSPGTSNSEKNKFSRKNDDTNEPTSKYHGETDKKEATNNFSTPSKHGDVVDASNRRTKNHSSDLGDRLANAPRPAESSNKNSNGDFSQGFDPFRVLQKPFGIQKQFQQHNLTRERTPMNRLVLGLRDDDDVTVGEDHQNQNKSRYRRSPFTKRDKLQASELNQREMPDGDDSIEDGDDDDDAESSGEADNDDDDDGDGDHNSNNGENINNNNNKTTSKKNNTNNNKKHFSADNIFDYLYANKNTTEHQKLNFKRTSPTNGNTNNSSAYVAYHQYKDFPVGLLALRPIRMNIDRHFIRAAIRVFASTWYKINALANQTDKGADSANNFSQEYSTKPYISHRAQQEQRMRNVQIATSLYNTKVIESDMHSRRMRRKRNISIADKFVRLSIEQYANDTVSIEHQLPSANAMQVNSSVYFNRFNQASSARQNVINISESSWPNAAKRNDSLDDKPKQFSSGLPNYLPNKIPPNDSSIVWNNAKNNQNISGLSHFNDTTLNAKQHRNNNDKQSNTTQTTPSSGTIVDASHASIQYTRINNAQIESDSQPMDSLNQSKLLMSAMAKQSSQTIVNNFSTNNLVRSPVMKRQNTWWSTKNDPPATDPQLKRPHHSSPNAQQVDNWSDGSKLDIPNSASGCYGAPNALNIRNSQNFVRYVW